MRFCRYIKFIQMKNSKPVYNLFTRCSRHQSVLTYARRYVTVSGVRNQQNFAREERLDRPTNNSQGNLRSGFRPTSHSRVSPLGPPPSIFGGPLPRDARPPEFSAGPSLNPLQEKLYNIENDIQQFGRLDPTYIKEFLKSIGPDDKLSPSNALTLFKCCGSNLPMYSSEKRIELLHEAWNLFQARGVKYDVSHYNALLWLYLYNEYDFAPVEILAKMEKEKIDPNRVTFQRLIQRFAQMGDIDGASKILEHMKSLDMPINEQVFNSLVYANIKTKNFDGMNSILSIMKKNEVEKTTETYLEMMKAYAEQGNIQAVEKILTEEGDVSFSDREILEVVYYFTKNDHKQHIDGILKLIKKTKGYLHDAVNCALRINALGASDVAIKILNTVPRAIDRSGQPISFGSILLRQAVDMNFNERQIVNLCENMKSAEIHKQGLEVIYTIAAEKRNKELAAAALAGLAADKSFALRPHCYWPLIALNSTDKDVDGVKKSFALINKIGGRIDLVPLVDFFWPNFDDFLSLDDVDKQFPSVPRQKFVTSSIIYHLQSNEKEKVLKAVENYGSDVYMSGMVLKALENYLFRTKDVSTAVILLMKLQENLTNPRFYSMDGNPIDFFVRRCVTGLSDDVQMDLFKQLKAKGFCVSEFLMRQIEAFSRIDPVRPELKEIFLEFVENGKKYQSQLVGRRPAQSSLRETMNDHNYTERNFADFARSAPLRELNEALALMSKHDKVQEIIKLQTEMEKNHVPPSPSVLLSMAGACVRVSDVENALKYLNLAIKSRIPIYPSSLLKFACFLASNDRFSDITQILKAEFRLPTGDFSSRDHVNGGEILSLIRKLVDICLSKDKVDEALSIVQTCIDKKIIGSTGRLYGPILDSYIEKKNTSKASELFIKLHSTHKILPNFISLMTALAEAGDAENLGKIVTIIQTTYGDVKSSIYFAVSLSNAGKFLAAKKVLQPLVGEQIFPRILMKYIDYLILTNNSKYIENLMKSTKNLPKIDREMLYRSLLTVYQQNKNVKAAANAWTTMQEENFTPSNEIMLILSSIYAENNQKTPFEVQPGVDLLAQTGVVHRADNRLQRFSRTNPHLILKELYANPTKESEIIELAQKSTAQHQFGPSAALWMHFLFSRRFAEADEFLKSSIDSKSILNEIDLISLCTDLKLYGKDDVLRYLLEKNVFNDIRPNARKMFYSYLIGINLDRQTFDSACDVIKEAEKDGVGLGLLNSAILARLSTELVRRGQPVPFSLESVREANVRRYKPRDGQTESIRQNETFVKVENV